MAKKTTNTPKHPPTHRERESTVGERERQQKQCLEVTLSFCGGWYSAIVLPCECLFFFFFLFDTHTRQWVLLVGEGKEPIVDDHPPMQHMHHHHGSGCDGTTHFFLVGRVDDYLTNEQQRLHYRSERDHRWWWSSCW